jgi:hypothetical protein
MKVFSIPTLINVAFNQNIRTVLLSKPYFAPTNKLIADLNYFGKVRVNSLSC